MRERKENTEPATSKDVVSETRTERIESERRERKNCGYRLIGCIYNVFSRRLLRAHVLVSFRTTTAARYGNKH